MDGNRIDSSSRKVWVRVGVRVRVWIRVRIRVRIRVGLQELNKTSLVSIGNEKTAHHTTTPDETRKP
jgi:hypothetical protein